MAIEFSMNQHERKKKSTLFKIFIFSIIEYICLNIYIIISGLTGDFNWPIERLTTTGEGVLIQILTLIAMIGGFYLFIQIIIYVILILNTPDDSD